MASVLTKPGTATIPEAPFINDVDKYLKDNCIDSANALFRQLEEQHQKYGFFEQNLSLKQKKLKAQVPDIRANLDVVKNLRKAKEAEESLQNFFKVNEGIFLKSEIPPTDTVCLWLGANVMLEYTLDEAHKLLTTNLESAEGQLKQIKEDLDFIRDQMTSTEVSMARTHNWEVENKKKLQGKGVGTGKAELK